MDSRQQKIPAKIYKGNELKQKIISVDISFDQLCVAIEDLFNDRSPYFYEYLDFDREYVRFEKNEEWKECVISHLKRFKPNECMRIRILAQDPMSPLSPFSPFNFHTHVEKKHHPKVLHNKRPRRIILIRHGESEANVDSRIYQHTPDYKIALKGVEMSKQVGFRLKNFLGNESSCWFVSPYKRTMQTFENLVEAFGGKDNVKWVEEPRLREQEWGNLQSSDVKEKMRERREFGSFYYRFPSGESGADVFGRVSNFLDDTLVQGMEKLKCENFIIVSHGYTCRSFLIRYYRLPVNLLQNLWNFDNAQYLILERTWFEELNKTKYMIDGIIRVNKESDVPGIDYPQEFPYLFREKLKDGYEIREWGGEYPHIAYYGKSFKDQIAIDKRIYDDITGKKRTREIRDEGVEIIDEDVQRPVLKRKVE